MTEHDLMQMEWAQSLRKQVRVEFDAAIESSRARRPQLETEKKDLEGKCTGWAKSLADPNLDPKVRDLVQSHLAEVVSRIEEIDAQICESQLTAALAEDLMDFPLAVSRLERLTSTIDAGDPTSMNLELAQYIDRIDCFADDRVTMRICRLGLFSRALRALLDRTPADNQENDSSSSPDARSGMVGKPRRRAKLRCDPFAENATEQKDAASFVADPNRFATLADKWFTEETVSIPKQTCWAIEHAAEVGHLRFSKEMTHEALARHFKKTVPTIRKALRHAAATCPELADMPKKMARARWSVDHASEVAEKGKTMSVMELADFFEVSDTTIREALALADIEAQSSLPPPAAEPKTGNESEARPPHRKRRLDSR